MACDALAAAAADDDDILLDATYDYAWLHEIGTGIDDCPLPHHVSSTSDILDLLQRVTSLITRLPRPSAVTIARLVITILLCCLICISDGRSLTKLE